MSEGQDRVKAAHRENYARLTGIKRRCDPDNVFHINQNIEPAASQTLSGTLAQPAVLTMESQMIFLDCPAYLDEHGAQRCGLPAEVMDCFTTRSTSGPIECVKIRCPSGHWFHAPLEFLTWNNAEGPGAGRLKTAGKVASR